MQPDVKVTAELGLKTDNVQKDIQKNVQKAAEKATKTINKADKKITFGDKVKENLEQIKIGIQNLGIGGDRLDKLGQLFKGGGWIALAAGAITAAGYAAMEIWDRLTETVQQAMNKADYSINKSQGQLKKTFQGEKEAKIYFERLKQLNDQENLSNTQKIEAIAIIDTLTKSYGNLGISINTVTGKIIGLQEGFERLGKITKDKKIGDSQNVFNEQKKKVNLLFKKYRDEMFFDDFFKNVKSIDDRMNTAFGWKEVLKSAGQHTYFAREKRPLTAEEYNDAVTWNNSGIQGKIKIIEKLKKANKKGEDDIKYKTLIEQLEKLSKAEEKLNTIRKYGYETYKEYLDHLKLQNKEVKKLIDSVNELTKQYNKNRKAKQEAQFYQSLKPITTKIAYKEVQLQVNQDQLKPILDKVHKLQIELQFANKELEIAMKIDDPQFQDKAFKKVNSIGAELAKAKKEQLIQQEKIKDIQAQINRLKRQKNDADMKQLKNDQQRIKKLQKQLELEKKKEKEALSKKSTKNNDIDNSDKETERIKTTIKQLEKAKADVYKQLNNYDLSIEIQFKDALEKLEKQLKSKIEITDVKGYKETKEKIINLEKQLQKLEKQRQINIKDYNSYSEIRKKLQQLDKDLNAKLKIKDMTSYNKIKKNIQELKKQLEKIEKVKIKDKHFKIKAIDLTQENFLEKYLQQLIQFEKQLHKTYNVFNKFSDLDIKLDQITKLKNSLANITDQKKKKEIELQIKLKQAEYLAFRNSLEKQFNIDLDVNVKNEKMFQLAEESKNQIIQLKNLVKSLQEQQKKVIKLKEQLNKTKLQYKNKDFSKQQKRLNDLAQQINNQKSKVEKAIENLLDAMKIQADYTVRVDFIANLKQLNKVLNKIKQFQIKVKFNPSKENIQELEKLRKERDQLFNKSYKKAQSDNYKKRKEAEKDLNNIKDYKKIGGNSQDGYEQRIQLYFSYDKDIKKMEKQLQKLEKDRQVKVKVVQESYQKYDKIKDEMDKREKEIGDKVDSDPQYQKLNEQKEKAYAEYQKNEKDVYNQNQRIRKKKIDIDTVERKRAVTAFDLGEKSHADLMKQNFKLNRLQDNQNEFSYLKKLENNDKKIQQVIKKLQQASQDQDNFAQVFKLTDQLNYLQLYRRNTKSRKDEKLDNQVLDINKQLDTKQKELAKGGTYVGQGVQAKFVKYSTEDIEKIKNQIEALKEAKKTLFKDEYDKIRINDQEITKSKKKIQELKKNIKNFDGTILFKSKGEIDNEVLKSRLDYIKQIEKQIKSLEEKQSKIKGNSSSDLAKKAEYEKQALQAKMKQMQIQAEIDQLTKKSKKYYQGQKTNLDKELQIKKLILQGKYEQAEKQKLINSLKQQGLIIDQKQIDAILQKKKALADLNINKTLKQQGYNLLDRVGSNNRQYEKEKRIRDLEQANGVKLTQDQKDKINTVVDIQFDMKKYEKLKPNFSDMDIKTNELTARGGFAGGAVVPDIDLVNKQIRDYQAKSCNTLSQIKNILQKGGII